MNMDIDQIVPDSILPNLESLYCRHLYDHGRSTSHMGYILPIRRLIDGSRARVSAQIWIGSPRRPARSSMLSSNITRSTRGSYIPEGPQSAAH